MPRKETTIITKETRPADETPEPASGLAGFTPAEPSPDDIELFLSRFGENARLKIYRVERSGEKSFLSTSDIQYWTEEWMQDTFGEGRYIVQVIDAQGKIRGTRQIVIGPPPADDTAPEPLINPAIQTPAADNGGDLRTQLIMAELAANREIMIRLIEKMGSQGNGMKDTIEAIAALKNIMPAPVSTSPLSSMDSILSLLSKGIEIGQTGTIDTSKKDGVMGMIKDILPAAGEVIKSLMPSRQAAPANAPQTAATALPGPAIQIEGIDAGAMEMLRHGIAYLKVKALQGKSVDTYINWISDSLEDPQWQPFVKLAQLPYEEFAKLDPELLQLPYRPWFEMLLTEVKAIISEAPSVDPQDEPEATDGTSKA